MKKLIIILIVILSVTGCIRQTINNTPGLSGVVIDGNSGKLLANVAVDDQFLTAVDGRFDLPATIDRKIWNFPLVFGAGHTIGQAVSFKKEGYRETTCLSGSFSMRTTKNEATVPLLKIKESEASIEPPLVLQLEDKFDSVACQAFVGSWVTYKKQPYLIDSIERIETVLRDDYKNTTTRLTLRSVARAVVTDVDEHDLKLTSPPNNQN